MITVKSNENSFNNDNPVMETDSNCSRCSDDNGDCPLTIAVEHGLADSLQTLLTVPSPHLDLAVTDGQGDNLAQLAVESEAGERQRCVELLCRDCRSVITHLQRLQVR